MNMSASNTDPVGSQVQGPPGLTLRALFRDTRWIWTLFILGLMVLELSLAWWQFQRYQLREEEKAVLSAQLRLTQVTLPLSGPVADLHFRKAEARGTYDFRHQFIWVGPRDRMESGPHLVTPLQLPDGRAILVDRGWMPNTYDTPEEWQEFNRQPPDAISGILLPGAAVLDPEFLATQTRPVLFWSRMDLAAIQQQLPYEILPVYLHEEPDEAGYDQSFPARTWYTLRTPPSMHLGYSIQWIMSALILGFLYAMIIRFIERRAWYRQHPEAVPASP